jgi:hypothetical protein
VAGSAQYTAVLDANVLYPALLRNVLLSLADADIYSAKWSLHIRDLAWRLKSPRQQTPWKRLFRIAWSPATST